MEAADPIYMSIAWLATLTSLLLLAARLRRRKLNLPPGPEPWPIVGNLNLIGSLPHRSIHDLSQKYGPYMQLQFGSFPVVVGSSADAAKFFLKTHDVAFTGRAKNAAGKYLTYNYSNITWSPCGAYWRQARRICATELFSAKRLASYKYIRAEETKGFLKGIFDCCGADAPAVALKDHLSTLSLNVISRMVLGRKYLVTEAADSEAMMMEEFKEMLHELFLLSGVLTVGDSIPWLEFMDFGGYVRRMKAVAKKFDAFLERVLDEHDERRKGVKDYVAKDMVDVLLQLAEDPDLDVKLERHGVKAFTLDMIAGGTDTSAVIVEWAISELLRKPEIFDKATEELDRVIGRERWVEEEDIPNLPYITAVVKETMRLHPVAPFLVPRFAQEHCKVDGYDIPAGTRVLVNVWSIGRDPAVWDDPAVFRPERFIGREIDVNGRDFELLPFGSGRRMCPGYSLGLKVIHASLANLLHGFKWMLPSGMKPEDLNMEEVFGLTTPRRFPLVAWAQPRLPPQLY